MRTARQSIAVVAAALTLAACAGDGGGTSSSAARNEAVVRMGVVESVREVVIDGGSGYAGAIAGGAVGGAAGSRVGGGSGASVSSVLGAVAGSLAGQALTQQAGKKPGVEITVRLESGELRAVRLTRAHLEEDAGKSLHEEFHLADGRPATGVDLNRAGTPLLEIVSEPDMRSAAEAVEYAKALHALVVWLGICDGNMQEGSFRCDANVSVRRPGQPFGTRREIKNLNSFRFLQQAIDFEVQWQIDRIEDGLSIEQATVLFNPDTGETRAMRTKEDAHDYRYFPDPDLPPLVIAPEWVARVKAAMPELPRAMAARFEQTDGLPAYDAAMMTQSLAFARFYEAARDAGAPAKLAANWLMGEVSKRLNAENRGIEAIPLKPATLATLIQRVVDGTVSNNGARQVFDSLWSGEAADVDAVIAAKGLKQMNDSGALEAIVDEVLAKNEKSVAEFRAGKDKAFNALVGQIMKASRGLANPAQAGELLKKKLGV